MNGMTVDEAIANQQALGRLMRDVRQVRDYLDSTVGEGNADEILRPVQWALPPRAYSRSKTHNA